jgi:hypothetical protein
MEKIAGASLAEMDAGVPTAGTFSQLRAWMNVRQPGGQPTEGLACWSDLITQRRFWHVARTESRTDDRIWHRTQYVT